MSNFANGDCIYFFKYSDTIEYFESISDDSDFIIISSSEWLLITYTNLLYDSNQFFYVTSVDDIYQYTENLEMNTTYKNLYLVIDVTNKLSDDVEEINEKNDEYEEVKEYITELLGRNECELVHTTDIFGRDVQIYQIK